MAFDLNDLKKVPWWGYAAGGGAVLGVGYYVVRHGQTSSQVNQAPVPAGLNMADLAGLPLDYQDYNADYAGDTTTNPGDTTSSPPPTPAPLPPIGQPITNPPGRPVPAPPAPAPTPAPTPPPQPQEQSVDVQPWPAWDSTLSGIGSHYGMTWQQLYGYDNNKATIDELAHEHGHYGDEYDWLFPGETIHVP